MAGNEYSVCSVTGRVMFYKPQSKQWVFAETSSGNGLAQIELFKTDEDQKLQRPVRYRVVGRAEADSTVSINSVLYVGMEYRRASEVFHQWQDSRFVYGLSFVNAEDANTFAVAVEAAIAEINKVHGEMSLSRKGSELSLVEQEKKATETQPASHQQHPQQQHVNQQEPEQELKNQNNHQEANGTTDDGDNNSNNVASKSKSTPAPARSLGNSRKFSLSSISEHDAQEIEIRVKEFNEREKEKDKEKKKSKDKDKEKEKEKDKDKERDREKEKETETHKQTDSSRSQDRGDDELSSLSKSKFSSMILLTDKSKKRNSGTFSTLSPELQDLKKEIMDEMRLELELFKKDMLKAIKEELQKK